MAQSSDNVVEFPSDSSRDVLTEILRKGARDLLAGAIEEEVSDYLLEREGLRDEAGHQHVVRNGYLPERTVQTGLGNVAVKKPRVRDRRPAEEREEFESSILPRYLRRTKSMEELLPWLYLKGVSSGPANRRDRSTHDTQSVRHGRDPRKILELPDHDSGRMGVGLCRGAAA